MKKFTFGQAMILASEKYGRELGMFSRLLTKTKNVVPGKYFSYGLNKIITKEELLEYEINRRTKTS